MKESIQEKYVAIVNIHAPNIGPPQYIRKMLTDIKGEINSNTTTLEVFNTPLTQMKTSSTQKTNKETQVLNDVLIQIGLIDIYRMFHSKAAEYIYISMHSLLKRSYDRII